MTSQPQLSPTPAPADLAGVATPAVQAPLLDSPTGATATLVEPAPVAVAAPVRRGLWWFLGSPARKPLLLGLAGSVVLLIGGLGAGGVLEHDPLLGRTPLEALRFGHGYNIAVTISYLGLALLVWGWVLLGRDVLAKRAGGRAVLSTAVVWTLPMIITPPLFTRDPYSYLAYGTLPLHGFDPYTYGPDMLTGPIQQNVHWFWQDTPAPYGPLFIAVAKAVASVTGGNMILGVIAIRLVLLVGLVLLVAALPGLVRHLGGRVSVALWLAVANPVTVVHLVGGPHNDLLTVGLLSAGTLTVLNRKHAAGIALVTLAAAVKATAAIALPFLVLVWAARMAGGSRNSRIAKATAAGVSVFVATFAVCSVVAGVGLGWLPALNAPSNIVNWLSLPTGVGQFVYTVANWLFSGLPETPFITVTRVLGVLLFLAIGVKQWLAARDGGPDGADAVRRAGVVLLLFPLLSPATLPWYFSWGMALLAAVTWSTRGMAVTIFVSIFLIVAAFPDGEVSLYAFGYLALTLAGALVAAISLRKPDPLGIRRRRRATAPAIDA
jgi:alpha-1,6-mannosyltransferase